MTPTIRPFRPADAAACLAIFDGNVPDYFHPGERVAFAAFLASDDFVPPRLRAAGTAFGRFWIATDASDAVVGCGGFFVDGADSVMSWGMVDRRFHRRGVGRALLEHRLAALRGYGTVRVSRVQTTAPVVGFFERFGYRVTKATTPGVVPELPLIELALAL